MVYNIYFTPNFEKEFKRLSKKYSSLNSDLLKLVEELKVNPTKGTLVFTNVHKIRMAITSKGKGKSGGARVFTAVQISQTAVTLFSIYSKGEKSTISDAEIKLLLQEIIS